MVLSYAKSIIRWARVAQNRMSVIVLGSICVEDPVWYFHYMRASGKEDETEDASHLKIKTFFTFIHLVRKD